MKQEHNTVTLRRARQLMLATLMLVGLLAMAACDSGSTYKYRGPTAPGPVNPSPGLPSGLVVTQSRPVQGFSGVALTGVGQVFVEQGAAESLTITAPEDFLPYLSSNVLGDMLELGKAPGLNVQSAQDIVFRVTVPRLERVRLSGVGDFDISGIDVNRFSAELTGIGRITARGRADRQVVELSGIGDYLAEDLQTRITTVSIHGQTHAVVRVSERLEGTVQYLCKLSYYGSPEVSVTGNGSVRRLGP